MSYNSVVSFFAHDEYSSVDSPEFRTTETLNEIVFPSPDTGFVVGANGTILRTFTGGVNGKH